MWLRIIIGRFSEDKNETIQKYTKTNKYYRDLVYILYSDKKAKKIFVFLEYNSIRFKLFRDVLSMAPKYFM